VATGALLHWLLTTSRGSQAALVMAEALLRRGSSSINHQRQPVATQRGVQLAGALLLLLLLLRSNGGLLLATVECRTTACLQSLRRIC
jgi:hypothetical protein